MRHPHSAQLRFPLRWTLSTGVVVAAMAIIMALQTMPDPTAAFSAADGRTNTGGTGGTSGNGGTGGTGGTGGPTPTPIPTPTPGGSGGSGGSGGEPILIGFSNGAGDPVDTLVLERSAGEADLFVKVDGMLPWLHDTVQLLVSHDPSVIEIVAAQCEGLFAGSFSPIGPVEVSTGRTSFSCGLHGGVSHENGTVMRLTLRRVASGDDPIEILTEGAFGTRLYSAGNPTSLSPTGLLIVEDPGPAPTPSPVPTPTAPPASSSGGGAGVAQQPGPTPSLPIPGIPTTLAVTAGDGWVEFSWQPPGNGGGTQVTDYFVRSADGETNRAVPASRLSVRFTDLVNGREYRFRVQALNNNGFGPFSQLSEPVIPAGPPSAPLDIAAEVTVAPTSVTISWKAPQNRNGADISSYVISEAAGWVSQRTVGHDVLTQSFAELPPGDYLFLVNAINRGGIGSAASVTASVPEAPEQLGPPAESVNSQAFDANRAEVAAQISSALGGSVTIEDGPLTVHPQSNSLRVDLPVQLAAPEEGTSLNSIEFAGFQLENLTVKQEHGQLRTATIDLGEQLQVFGEATLHENAGEVSVEIRHLQLRYSPSHSPPQSEHQWLADSPSFTAEISQLSALPAFSSKFSASLGPPDLPEVEQLTALLMEHHRVVSIEDTPGNRRSGFVVNVEHDDGTVFSPVGTTFSFRLRLPFENDDSLVAIKLDDAGVVHVRPVSCLREELTTSCSALFDGDAAGFSTFAVIQAERLDERSPSGVASPEPQPTARPSATSTPPAAVLSTLVPDTARPNANAPTAPMPSPSPSPAPVATPKLDLGLNVSLPPGDSRDTHPVIAVVAFAALGIVIVGALVGYVVNRQHRTGLSMLAVSVFATALLVLVAANNAAAQRVHAAGEITSQGDAALRSDIVKSNFLVDGTGITVGILSDSFGCDAAALASDIAAGELPADMAIADDSPGILCPFASDRGRAVAQLIHDVAPGANLTFETVITGESVMASKILKFASSGVDIIVDDFLHGSELFFQDDLIAQTIDQVTASGIIYMTSAGDSRIASYESTYTAGEAPTVVCSTSNPSICTVPGTWHDFDPGTGPGEQDQMLDISLSGEATSLMLQWDQPAGSPGGGNTSDLDLFVFDRTGALVAVSTIANDSTGEPTEQLRLAGLDSIQVAVSHGGGPAPAKIKLIVSNGATINEFDTGSSAIVGHRNAAGAITVGPVDYNDTAAFGGTPQVEPGAPLGGVETLFAADGSPIVPPIVRQKPDIVAPSGTDTTFGPVRGSPAAAAHTAGAVALLLQLRQDLHASGQLGQEEIRRLLTQTAIDLGPAGPDLESGYGLIDAMAAATRLTTDPPISEDDSYATQLNIPLDISAPGLLTNDSDSEGQPLSAQLISGPVNGNLLLNANGSFTYTPDQDFTGDDSFSYVAADGSFTSVPATVTITVGSVGSLETSVGLQGVSAGADFGSDEIDVILFEGDETARQIVLTPGGSGAVNLDGLGPGTYDLYAVVPGFLIAEALDIQIGVVPGATTVLPDTQLPAGDANSDDWIDEIDAVLVAMAHGTVHVSGIRRDGAGNIVDLNGDAVTNGADLSLTVSNIGLAGFVPW